MAEQAKVRMRVIKAGWILSGQKMILGLPIRVSPQAARSLIGQGLARLSEPDKHLSLERDGFRSVPLFHRIIGADDGSTIKR